MEGKLNGGEEYDQLVSVIRKLSKFMTIWPLDLGDVNGDETRLSNARKLQGYHKVFILVFMSAICVAQLADAVRKWGDMAEFTECCLPASSCGLTIFRLAMYSMQEKNLHVILERMRYDWANSTEEDRAILRRKCGPAFVMTNHFMLCISITMSVVVATPTLLIIATGSDERVLPYGGYFFVDDTKTPTYHILFAFKILGAIYGLTNVAAVNSLNLISIIHASAKFLVLQSHLSSLKSHDGHSNERLRLAIQEHQRAIEFADILEEIINKMALGQFIISTGLVCFAGLQVTELMDNKIHLAKHMAYLASAIFEIFLFSYGGYQLTLESESVGASAFNSDWVGSTFTQNLQIVMMRSTKPSKITAAKFYDMSLESFSTVLSTSFSYFTTLRAVNEE